MAYEVYSVADYERLWRKANPDWCNFKTLLWDPGPLMSSDCGWVWHASPHVNVVPSRCAKPPRGYSWPGSSSDRTVTGVWAHELGHRIHYLHGPQCNAVVHGLRALGGARVSGYEPDAYETFAETMRLFICNPKLLELGRPARFEYMLGLRLNPVRRLRKWEHGLAYGAAPRHHAMCERWLERGGR